MNRMRVGRITAALSLIALGSGLLADNLLGTAYSEWLWRLWPAALVSLGLEYLIHSRRHEVRGGPPPSLDLRSLAILLAVVLILGAARLARQVADWLPLPFFSHLAGAVVAPPIPPVGPGSPTPPSAAPAAEKTATLDLTGARTLGVEMEAGRMVVTGNSPDGQVHARARVVAAGLTPDRARVPADALNLEVLEGERPTVRVDFHPPIPPLLPWGNLRVELEVQVPAGLDLTLVGSAGTIAATDLQGNVAVTLDAGEVSLTRIQGSARVQADFASIQATDVQGTLEAVTGPGTIRALRFDGGRLESDLGSIQAEDWQGPLVLTSHSGSITAVTGFPVSADLEVHTDIGNVELTLPQNSSATFALRTEVGSVEVPPQGFAVSRQGPRAEARGTLGDGRATVRVETDTGRIALRLR